MVQFVPVNNGGGGPVGERHKSSANPDDFHLRPHGHNTNEKQILRIRTNTHTPNCIFILLLLLLYVSAATATTRGLINFRKFDSRPLPSLGPWGGGNKNNRFQFLIGFCAIVFALSLWFTTLTLSGQLYMYI